jgi:ubiquinone/menaquinone biosynthesis C-methylase UbiE
MSDRFYDAGAAGYDQICGFACLEFVPTLLRMARIAPGQNVLDVATGTGNTAEAIGGLVGPSGSVMATDISAGMLYEARKRLAGLSNTFLSRWKWAGSDAPRRMLRRCRVQQA